MDWQLIVDIGVVWTALSFVTGIAFGQVIRYADEHDEIFWAIFDGDWRTGHNRPPGTLLRALG